MTEVQELIEKSIKRYKEGSIVKGRILEIRPREFLVDIGYKSEGIIPAVEFDNPEEVEIGDEIEVLLERLENDEGMVVLSKEKAAHRQNWEKIVKVFQAEGIIKGRVKSVVKGGLMVNIGVEAFLPASQIDIIPPKDLNQFVGNTYDFKIVKMNDDRKNVVLSRRELIEQERAEKRQRFLDATKPGDMVTGTVKNLTDFGAFIDLDGMDGLLHITVGRRLFTRMVPVEEWPTPGAEQSKGGCRRAAVAVRRCKECGARRTGRLRKHLVKIVPRGRPLAGPHGAFGDADSPGAASWNPLGETPRRPEASGNPRKPRQANPCCRARGLQRTAFRSGPPRHDR